ncbi:MAG: ATP-dependent RecD-like DNA helicase [Lentisphaerae bacterium]|nr:ATP-dependent RecD-like DNA helicase [Lentisphaerota bacterium]MCP4101863.1 ATP-dependent RecD-like DNA helicase [Lentisphaerota bacterium]
MDNSKNNQGLASHTVRGEISRVVYANDEGTYSVLRVKDTSGQEHVVVGNISGAFEGQNIEATGKLETHKEFGRQLRAEHFRFTLPSTREGIVKYLSSGMIEGIGPKYAECIVEHFGEKTLDILDNYSIRLKEVPGIGKKRAAMISAAWKEQSAKRDIFIFLQGLGISSLFCQKLYKEYGDQAAQVVKNNPYQLADEIDGIGFLMADRIASSLGIAGDAAIRLAAGAIYTMNQLTTSGHCCYPAEEFVLKCAETLKVDSDHAQYGIDEALKQRLLILEHDMYYPRNLFKAESELPGHLLRLISIKRHSGQRLLKVPAAPNLQLSDEQLSAVERAGHSPVSIITGGPGVGKTTVVGEIVRRAKAAGLKIYLAAPTGRAAKRMSESTGFSARTLHRMLKWEPAEKSFAYNQFHPLTCDLLIVDEVSMLDLSLALCLFRAIKAGTTVILVGDADQLPSVGPGNVFHCMLQSKLFLVTHLNKIFRQGEGSHIIFNAHRVNHGQMPENTPKQQDLSDFYWIEQEDPERVADIILRMQSERIPQRFNFHPVRDIQVLTPMNRGLVGTATLNQTLQEKLNPGHKPQFKSGDKVFKSGDKVMQITNNYDKNVFNGDMGRIGNIDMKEKQFSVYFDNRAVSYEFTETDQLSLAYAITIHKSQGSEFPVVIMPMLNQHYMMLQRNLLYTGMTRARQLLILVGSQKAIGMAVRNSRLEPRYSRLLERLTEYRQEQQ